MNSVHVRFFGGGFDSHEIVYGRGGFAHWDRGGQ